MVVLLLLDPRLLPIGLCFACVVLLLVPIKTRHLAGRKDRGKGGSKAALVAMGDAYMGIHDSMDVCVLPSEVVGWFEWRPPTRLVWPGRPDRDAHILVHALAGDSAGRGGVHEIDMESWLGRLGRSGKREGGTRVACLCRRHRAHWEIDGADEGEVPVHAGDHVACLEGGMGVVERGESGEGIDGYNDENARFERSSVESCIVVQPMGHRAQGRGYERKAGEG